MEIPQIAQTRAHGRAQAHTPEKLPEQAKSESNHSEAAKHLPAVSIGFKDNPLALLLSRILDKMDEFVSADLGEEESIQKTYESGLDVSPEATAERIVSLSTNFFEAFKQRHAGEDEGEVLKNFMDTIGSGIERGFAEAREILTGLGVLEGDVADSIDQTYEQVQTGLTNFWDQFDYS